MKERSGRRTGKTSRIVYLCIAAAYLAVAVGATVYAQTGYLNSLPAVTLGHADQARVPVESLQYTEGAGYVLNTVQQQDGPWGKRYLIKQMSVQSVADAGGGMALVYEALNLETPLAVSSTVEFLQDGQEVRLAG